MIEERVGYAEAHIDSLEDRVITTDQRALAVQESLRVHVQDCASTTSPGPEHLEAIVARLCSLEQQQQHQEQQHQELVMENQRLHALLATRNMTSPDPEQSFASHPRLESEQLTALNSQVNILSSKLSLLTRDLRLEELKRDNLEANSRLYNLEISGLPVVSPEHDDPMELARKVVSRVTRGQVSGDEVDVAHRKLGGPKNIILRFRSRTARDRVYAAKKCLKDVSRKELGYATDGDVFLNESLTFDRSSLMRDVRAKVKSFNAGKVGASRCKLLTDRGVIKIKPPHQKYQKVFCMTDVEELL